jgi:glycosyltransferase involved in cell wall biosynthesis
VNGAVLISVVIPCYNARATLPSTLASVAAQQHPSLEIVVVDDGSSDGSADWLRATHPEVQVIEQTNQGVAAARNAGIAAAKGDWIAFLDADDLWLPGKLAAQVQRLQQQPDCQLCYTAWATWTSQASEPDADWLASLLGRRHDAKLWAGASGWIYPELLLDCMVWTSTVLMRRSLLNELGGFDTSLRIGEDYDLWFRASRRTRIERVAQPLALYRLHPGSITRSAPTDNYRARVIERALSQWGWEGPDGRRGDESAVRHGLAKSWVDFGVSQLATGNNARCWQAVRAAWQQQRWHLNAWKLALRCQWSQWRPRSARSDPGSP